MGILRPLFIPEQEFRRLSGRAIKLIPSFQPLGAPRNPPLARSPQRLTRRQTKP